MTGNQHPKYVHGGDLRGNVTRANTKIMRKWTYQMNYINEKYQL